MGVECAKKEHASWRSTPNVGARLDNYCHPVRTEVVSEAQQEDSMGKGVRASAAGSERNWEPFRERYREGEWRAPIFRDMLADELSTLRSRPTVLDIGCGRGFDDDAGLQRDISAWAGQYLGVEPDPHIALSDCFHAIHRCSLETAPLRKSSVDLAFAVMVLEHLAEPAQFWDKLYHVLRRGGVFWGFT